MLPSEGNYFCGYPSHGNELLVVLMRLSYHTATSISLAAESLRNLLCQGLPCIIKSSKPISDPPSPPLLWAAALLILSSRTEISFAVPYAPTHTEQAEEISRFSWSKTEKTNNGWINKVLPPEYCGQIKAGLLKGVSWSQAHGSHRTVQLCLSSSPNPSFSLSWNNASEKRMGRCLSKKYRCGLLPVS